MLFFTLIIFDLRLLLSLTAALASSYWKNIIIFFAGVLLVLLFIRKSNKTLNLICFCSISIRFFGFVVVVVVVAVCFFLLCRCCLACVYFSSPHAPHTFATDKNGFYDVSWCFRWGTGGSGRGGGRGDGDWDQEGGLDKEASGTVARSALSSVLH